VTGSPDAGKWRRGVRYAEVARSGAGDLEPPSYPEERRSGSQTAEAFLKEFNGRGDRITTCDSYVPMVAT